MKIRRRNGNCVITLPWLDEPQRSGSGKSMLVASTRGVRRSKIRVWGRNVLYVANVYFYPENASKASGNAKKSRKKRAAASKKPRHHQDK